MLRDDRARATDGDRDVGPVLVAGPVADAVVAAIREQTRDVVVVDRGAYVRVLAPDRCDVVRAAIERHAGAPFRLPQDLERIMPSFRGRLRVTDDAASWER
jgi:hypothetical protein